MKTILSFASYILLGLALTTPSFATTTTSDMETSDQERQEALESQEDSKENEIACIPPYGC